MAHSIPYMRILNWKQCSAAHCKYVDKYFLRYAFPLFLLLFLCFSFRSKDKRFKMEKEVSKWSKWLHFSSHYTVGFLFDDDKDDAISTAFLACSEIKCHKEHVRRVLNLCFLLIYLILLYGKIEMFEVRCTRLIVNVLLNWWVDMSMFFNGSGIKSTRKRSPIDYELVLWVCAWFKKVRAYMFTATVATSV